MKTSIKTEICPECASPCPDTARNCPACDFDIGYPNVRMAVNELSELKTRFEVVAAFAKTAGLASEFQELVTEIDQHSHVVVAIPTLYAISFLSNRTTLYTTYESMVDSGTRSPAPFVDDSHRCAVGGKFFGSYAKEIRYGALSLNNHSLHNYGEVFFTIKSKTIEKRTSFLSENTYHFAENNKVNLSDPFPKGYRSDWNSRSILVASKLGSLLSPGDTSDQFSKLLVKQGADRSTDDCVEAHIHGTFNDYAVESICFSNQIKKRDLCTLEKLARNKGIGIK